MKNKYWSDDDDRILISEVKKNPNNLTKAFEKVAKKLDRTPAACSQRWYNNKHKFSVCFMLVGKNGSSINGKNHIEGNKFKMFSYKLKKDMKAFLIRMAGKL